MSNKRLMIPQGASIEGYNCQGWVPGEICWETKTEVPPGSYIVNWERRSDDEDGCAIVQISAANWEDDDDWESRVTFHSNKYIYEVKRSDLILKKFDLLEAMVP